MGVIHHNAILATTWDDRQINNVKEWLSRTSITVPYCTDFFVFVKSKSNGYTTVILAPDGSKEGWTHSNEMDLVRDRFIGDILILNNEYWRWVEIGYGDLGQSIIRGNNVNKMEEAS